MKIDYLLKLLSETGADSDICEMFSTKEAEYLPISAVVNSYPEIEVVSYSKAVCFDKSLEIAEDGPYSEVIEVILRMDGYNSGYAISILDEDFNDVTAYNYSADPSYSEDPDNRSKTLATYHIKARQIATSYYLEVNYSQPK